MHGTQFRVRGLRLIFSSLNSATNELEAEINEADSSFQRAMKKMRALANKRNDKGKMCAIGVLSLVAITLLAVVVKK
jgi:hypothetical protein